MNFCPANGLQKYTIFNKVSREKTQSVFYPFPCHCSLSIPLENIRNLWYEMGLEYNITNTTSKEINLSSYQYLNTERQAMKVLLQ